MSKSTIRSLLIVQFLLLSLLIALVGWWSTLLLDKSHALYELQIQTGVASTSSLQEWTHFKTMVFWEGLAFVGLAFLTAAFSLRLLYRDRVRTKQLQGFFAGMTHELRTPMASIRLQAESIATRIGDDEHMQRWLNRLIFDTRRMETQIDRALELVRLGNGEPLSLEAVHTNTELTQWIQHEAQYYNDRLTLQIHLEPAKLFLANSGVRILIRNLLENTIRHSKSSPPTVHISGQLGTNGNYILKVEDNGSSSSIPFEKLGQLFQKDPKSPGSGVGLYLVRLLVEEMGGQISFPKQLPFCIQISFPIREELS